MKKRYISEILTNILDKDISEDRLDPQTNLVTEFGLTSLDMMYFIVELEKKMCREIDLSTFDIRMLHQFQLLESYLNDFPDGEKS